MAFLFDFFPVLLFFLAYQWKGIFFATGVIVAATLLQVAVQWVRTRRVKPMHLVTAVIVFVFGGITLLLGDAEWIKWKVTVVYWLFAAAYLGSAFIGSRRTVLERLLGGEFSLQPAIWRRLNIAWVVFFVLLGAANLYVMFNFDTDTWVNFKFYGVLGLILVFVIGQGFYLVRHIGDEVTQDSGGDA